MSQMIKFNLPKVKIRVKTNPAQSEALEPPSPIFKEYTAAPCVFQERLKMKKQIQDSYLRFRKKKKNNYMKQFCTSNKKHSPVPVEKQATIIVKTKTNSLLKQVEFTFEVERQDGRVSSCRRQLPQRQRMVTCLSSKKTASLHRQLLSGSCQESSKNIIFSRNNSLHVSCLQNAEDTPIALSGKKCNYNQFSEARRLEEELKKTSKGKEKKMQQNRKSSSFKIDPWRAENMSKLRHYFDDEQFHQGY